MRRMLLQIILPLAGPALVYLLYRAWARGRNAPEIPWWVVGGLGMGLAVLVSLVVVLGRNAATPDEHYTPPHMENGQLVPGGFTQTSPPASANR